MLKVFKLSSIPKFNQVRKVLKFFSTETKSMTPEQYEKEWTEIYLNKRNERFNYLESVLSEEEKKEVIGLLTKIVNLNEDEKTYYKYLLHSSLGEDVQQDSLSPSTYIKLENTWPKTNKNWHQSRNMQSALNTFSGNQDAVGMTLV